MPAHDSNDAMRQAPADTGAAEPDVPGAPPGTHAAAVHGGVLWPPEEEHEPEYEEEPPWAGGGGYLPADDEAQHGADAGWGLGSRAGGFLASEASGCEDCGCLSFSQEFWGAYKVMVCTSCRRAPKYNLVAKGTAKERYLLTDRDLGKLGFITKANPQHKTWSEMKLYLELQVKEVAVAKHGSLEAIQEAKQQRLQAKLTSRVDRAKRSASEQDSGGGGDDDGEPGQDDGAGEGSGARGKRPHLTAAQQRVRARLEMEAGAGGPQGRAGRQDARLEQPAVPAVQAVEAEEI